MVAPGAGEVMTGTDGHGVGTLNAVESVALLFEPLGSETVPGGFTVAVLLSVPAKELDVEPLAKKVTDPDARILTNALMFPEPDAGHDEPAVAEQDQDTPENCAGNESVTVAPTTAFGPKLVTVMR